MDFRHLRYVTATARNGSFSAAALELKVQQPIVSRRVRELEEELGTALFDRSTAGAKLTPVGESFSDMAGRILDDLQRLSDRTRAAVQGRRGSVALGFYKSLSSGSFRLILRRFREDHPDIDIDLLEAPFAELMADIQSGKIDVAIILGEPDRCPALNTMAIGTEHLMAALPEDHPLAEHPFIYWSDLKGERFLISHQDPGPDIRNILIAKLAAPSDEPVIVSLHVSRESILSLVGTGEGISLQCECASGLTDLGAVFRPLHDGNGATRIGYLACWHPDNSNPALETFLEALRPET
ncbi:LysR substrate-binding domain-containing protein [Paracoccus onubensis]|uniref:LysR family transcriptional regulator n=1 Tax=Paracoccus onubensis TaxID=1675788 RepID=UPI00272F84FD|nr:LysR family transcriptional regulator [Paracoccus onubensis]MDP0929691.1 LysR substrate-binding domain-containing protein [Paracoccus onubensis]